MSHREPGSRFEQLSDGSPLGLLLQLDAVSFTYNYVGCITILQPTWDGFLDQVHQHLCGAGNRIPSLEASANHHPLSKEGLLCWKTLGCAEVTQPP